MKSVAKIGVFFLAVSFFATLFVGCKTTQYVPVPYPEYHTEWKHDSIDRWHYHKEYVKGDYVYVHDSVFIDRLQYLWKHDSIKVPEPYPVHDTTYVKTPLTKWQAFQQKSWWWMAVWLVGFVLWKTRKLWLPYIKNTR